MPSRISFSCTPDLHFHLLRTPEPLLWKVSFARGCRTTTKLLRTTSSMLIWAFNDGTKLFSRIGIGRRRGRRFRARGCGGRRLCRAPSGSMNRRRFRDGVTAGFDRGRFSWTRSWRRGGKFRDGVLRRRGWDCFFRWENKA